MRSGHKGVRQGIPTGGGKVTGFFGQPRRRNEEGSVDFGVISTNRRGVAIADPHLFPWSKEQLALELRKVVKAYWRGRSGQSKRQGENGIKDTGTRSEVTGGQHLNGILRLLVAVARSAGFSDAEIRFDQNLELPGYFRPQKKWDLVIVRSGRLCAAVELKSQAGSFGNNFNNRSEEAIGCSTDFWTAFREGAMGAHAPWLGYFFLLEEAEKSTHLVGLKKGVFPPLPVFEKTSYADRYAILCERLVLERKFTSTSLILAPRGIRGDFREPHEQLRFYAFMKSLHGHLAGCA